MSEWAECRARSAMVRATPSCTEPSSAAAGAAPNEAEQDEAEAEREFLTASVAVWRSIDEREAMPGGYSAQPLMQDTELRKVERAAWERYRDACAAAGEAT